MSQWSLASRTAVPRSQKSIMGTNHIVNGRWTVDRRLRNPPMRGVDRARMRAPSAQQSVRARPAGLFGIEPEVGEVPN